MLELGESGWVYSPTADGEPKPLWSVPLEWTADWGKFGGLGRYNLETAWRFDRLLRRAEEAGVAHPLVLLDENVFLYHNKYNWLKNPLSARLGGPLDAQSKFFTDAAAQKRFNNLLRYMLAQNFT